MPWTFPSEWKGGAEKSLAYVVFKKSISWIKSLVLCVVMLELKASLMQAMDNSLIPFYWHPRERSWRRNAKWTLTHNPRSTAGSCKIQLLWKNPWFLVWEARKAKSRWHLHFKWSWEQQSCFKRCCWQRDVLSRVHKPVQISWLKPVSRSNQSRAKEWGGGMGWKRSTQAFRLMVIGGTGFPKSRK